MNFYLIKEYNIFNYIIYKLLSLLLLFPVDVVKEILFKIIAFTSVTNNTFYKIYDIIFTIIEAIICFAFFIYMFNKRYEDIDKIRNKREDRIAKSNEIKTEFQRKNVEDEDFELPKQAEKKKL